MSVGVRIRKQISPVTLLSDTPLQELYKAFTLNLRGVKMRANECILRGTFNVTCLSSREPSVEFRVKNKSLHDLASHENLYMVLAIDLKLRVVTIRKSEVDSKDALLLHPRIYEKSKYTVTTKSAKLKEYLERWGVYDDLVKIARKKSNGCSTTVCMVCYFEGLPIHHHDRDSELVVYNLPSAKVNLKQNVGVDVYWKDVGIEISRVVTDDRRNRLGSRARLLHMALKLSREVEDGNINRGVIIVPSSAKKLVRRSYRLLNQVKDIRSIWIVYANADENNHFKTISIKEICQTIQKWAGGEVVSRPLGN